MPYTNNPDDNTRVHYETSGSGEPLILLHGSAGSLETWKLTGYVERLESDYRVINVDTRGHGKTVAPHDPEAYRVEKRVADICAVMDAESVSKSRVWGYSMGGMMTFALGALAPQRIEKAVSGGAHPYQSRLEPAQAEWFKEVRRVLEEEGMEGFIRSVGGHFSDVPDDVRDVFLQCDPKALTAMSVASLELDDLTVYERFFQSDFPALVYSGTEDLGMYELAREASETMASCEFRSFEGFGHHEAFREIDTVFPVIARFLNS